MTQKNIIITFLVLILLFLIFGYSNRHYGGWEMMGWMHNRGGEMEEHMEEFVNEDGESMLEEMEEHMEFNEDSEVYTSADNAPPGSMHNLPVPDAVAAVKSQIASELGISEGSVIVMSAYRQEWPDSCLGLGSLAESCLVVSTPGYEVTILAQGSERTFRTNATGSVVREE